jgi:hypothetical protein
MAHAIRSYAPKNIAAFVAVAAVYALPWIPLFSMPIERPIVLASVVCVAFPIAFALVGWARSRFPRAAAAAVVPYWALLAAAHAYLTLMAYCMDPPGYAACILLALAAYAAPRGGAARPVVASAAALLTAGAAFLEMRQHSPSAAALVLVGGAAGLGGTLWFFRRGAFSSVSRTALAFAVFVLPIYSRGALVYRATFPRSARVVLEQPGVRAIFTYDDPRFAGRLPTEIHFLMRQRGTERFVLGPQKPFHDLTLLTPGDPPRVRRVDLGQRGSDNAMWDPDDSSRLWVGGGNRFHEVSVNSEKILRSTVLGRPAQNLNFVRFDPRRNRFLLSQDLGDAVSVVDRETLRVTGRILTRPRSRVDDIWFDPVRDLIWSDSRFFHIFGRRLDAYRADNLALEKTYTMPWDFGFNFSTIDAAGARAYLASTITGRVRVLSLETCRVVDEFRVETGIRNLVFDAARRWVLIGSYFRGRLFVYDVDRREMRGPLFLGKRLRWVEVDAERGVWTTATAAGGFEIAPDLAFPRLR